MGQHDPLFIEGKSTERWPAEEALRESEAKYRDLVEGLNDVIFAHDENGVITYVSPVIAPLGGYSPAELIGHSFSEFIHPQDLPALLESFQRTLAGHLEPSEFRVISKSGEIHWARSSSRPIVQGDRVVGLRGVLANITERKQAEERTKALLEIATDTSGTLNLDEILARVQRRTAEVLPCEIVATFYWDPTRQVFRMIAQYGIPTELLPDAEALAFPPDQPFGGRLTNGQPVVINDITEPSGLPVTLLTHFRIAALVAAPLLVRSHELGTLVACTTVGGRRFDAGQVELCHGIARQLAVGIEAAELYKAQQEEAQVARALARVGQELIASLDTPVVLERLCRLTAEVLECDYSYTTLWQPAEKMFVAAAHWGFSPEQWNTLRALQVPCEAGAGLVARLEKEAVVEVRLPVPAELIAEAMVQFGEQFSSARTVLFLALQRGQQLIGIQTCAYQGQKELTARHRRIAHGISQLASLALANARLFEELERANHLKEDFVGTMSHELRTPLHIILGYEEQLRDETFGPLTPEQRNILKRIEKSAKELLYLINTTLDLSRLQSQRLPLTRQEVQVADLLNELAAEAQQVHCKPAVRLEWRTAPILPPLHTDPLKLKRVLSNLITNAVKFTDAGTVTIEAQLEEEGVAFSVSDTGVGIAPQALAVIFEPFRQVDSSTTRQYRGVGLGLYIVRQLVALLEGTVSVNSEPGKGSSFRVWIPQPTSGAHGRASPG